MMNKGEIDLGDVFGLIPKEELVKMPEMIIAESLARQDMDTFYRMIEAPLEALAKIRVIEGKYQDESVFRFTYRDKVYHATFNLKLTEAKQ